MKRTSETFFKSHRVAGTIIAAIFLFTANALWAQGNFGGLLSIPHHLVAVGDHPFSPGAWVELNPCPFPPAYQGSQSNLGNPSAPSFNVTNTAGNEFEIFLGANDIFGAVNFPAQIQDDHEPIDLIPPPNADGFFEFGGMDPGGHVFHISGRLDLTGPGGGPVDPASWAALNPCPLPPGSRAGSFPDGTVQMLFDPPPTPDTIADFIFVMTIDGGDPISFREVPVKVVPETGATLVLLSMTCLGYLGLRRRIVG